MKALLQRVTRARVTVGEEVAGEIGQGLAVLVGVAGPDTTEQARELARKTIGLRIFSDPEGKFNLSALDVQAELLVVSQFTLLADTHKGKRPSFAQAAPPQLASRLIDDFVTEIRSAGLKVATGRFGAHMQLEIHNDGPVTILLDSNK